MTTQTQRRYFQTKKEVKAWLAEQGISVRKISLHRGRFDVRVEGVPPWPVGVQRVTTYRPDGVVDTFEETWRPVPTIFLGSGPLIEERARQYEAEQVRLKAAGLLEPRPITDEERSAAQRHLDALAELQRVAAGTNVSLSG